jgi:hypothetical protein
MIGAWTPQLRMAFLASQIEACLPQKMLVCSKHIQAAYLAVGIQPHPRPDPPSSRRIKRKRNSVPADSSQPMLADVESQSSSLSGRPELKKAAVNDPGTSH